ncbi:paramyosin-like [Stylophora pistillata]|uniref:paramyosin-like n=1 Tax=Stylophora pistillata TaxID=50429 RepID=UPI000C054B13|nr:paramyosin-like [Stylophora pistillata]
MASQNADPRQSQEELEKLLSALEEDNRKLEIDLSAHNKKIVNISAFRADTRRAMAEELVRLETERDNLLDELQKLEKDNERYTRELEEHDRRSRDRQELEIVSNSDVEELERKNAQLTEEIRGIEHKIEILISTIAALTTTIQMTDKITVEYGSELEDQRKKLNVITNEIAFKEFEIQKYENGIKIMDDDVERKTAELREAELENSSLEESIKKDEIQVKVTNAENLVE